MTRLRPSKSPITPVIGVIAAFSVTLTTWIIVLHVVSPAI